MENHENIEDEKYNEEYENEEYNENIENVEDVDFEENNENEIYTVDINSKKILIGGGNDAVEIFDQSELSSVFRIEGFSDSIIYSKFISDDTYIVVAVNGEMGLFKENDNICMVEIGEDISSVAFNEKLVIGCVSGKTYLYDQELNHINTFKGHESEIIEVDYREGRTLSLSDAHFTAHLDNGKCLYTVNGRYYITFKYSKNDVFCLSRESKVQIFKEKIKLHEVETEGAVETIEHAENSFVLGGDFTNILLVNYSGKLATYKLETGLMTNKIKLIDQYKVLFSSQDGLICTLDLRSIKTLKMYNSENESIFDFAIYNNIIILGGDNGHRIIDLNVAEQVVLSEN